MPCLVRSLPIRALEILALQFRERYAPGVTGALGIDRLEEIVEFGLEIDVVPLRGLIARTGTRGALTSDGRHIVVDADLQRGLSPNYFEVLLHEGCHATLHRHLLPPRPPTCDEFIAFHDSIDAETKRIVEAEAAEFARRIAMPTPELRPVFACLYEQAQDRYATRLDAAERHVTLQVAEYFGVTMSGAQARLRGLWEAERHIKSPALHARGCMAPRGAVHAALLGRPAA